MLFLIMAKRTTQKVGSGREWISEETVVSCKAYLSASEDSESGSGNKKDVFHANNTML